MGNTRFQDLTNAVDDLVDDHLAEPLTLHYKGIRYRFGGTINVRQVEQVSDGGLLSFVNQLYVSVATRRLPLGLTGSHRAKLVRRDAFASGDNQVFTVVSVETPRSGRTPLVLERSKNAVSSVEPRTTDAARQNADPAPHR